MDCFGSNGRRLELSLRVLKRIDAYRRAVLNAKVFNVQNALAGLIDIENGRVVGRDLGEECVDTVTARGDLPERETVLLVSELVSDLAER